jgi:8-hydroxy-5-deazaflavin:NADPH oxidoreductase
MKAAPEPAGAALPSVGIVGGTGAHGRGLALRLAMAGHAVALGSRDRARSSGATADVQRRAAPFGARLDLAATTNAAAAESGDVVLLAMPWDYEADLVTALRPVLAGKIVVSCANPLAFDATGPVHVSSEHPSAAERAADLLPESSVVGAFHHLSAQTLLDPACLLASEDVLVCGDDADAKAVVEELCRSVTGRAGIDAGPLRMARQIEPFTVVLISVNRRYATGTGISLRHSDVQRPPALVRPA